MWNEKKIAFQQRKIEELTKEIESLRQENLILSTQLNENKNEVLLRKKALDDKEAQLDETRKVYESTIVELRMLQSKYNQCIKDAKKAKEKYIAEIQKQLKKIRNQ